MKKLLILSLILLFSISCSKDNNGYLNPYLPNYPVNITLNINFNDDLRYEQGSAIVQKQGSGGPSYGAIIVFNIGKGQYRAYDLMCPNHPISPSCSKMTLDSKNSSFVTCYCTNEHDQPMKYFLEYGTSLTPGAKYAMKPYPAVRRGDVIYVTY